MCDVFSELQESWFFCRKTTAANNHDEIPYPPVLWRVFTSILDKKKIENLGLKYQSHFLILV